MSELIVEKISPDSEILDIKGKLKLQGNLEATGTFLSTFLNAKPNDLDIPTIIINDAGGYGFSYIIDGVTNDISQKSPHKGVKFHTVIGGRRRSFAIDTFTMGNIQGGSGSLSITPESLLTQKSKDQILIETSNLLIKDPHIPLNQNSKSKVSSTNTRTSKAAYNLISKDSKLYLGSLPIGATSSSRSEFVRGLGTNYRSIDSGSVVVRSDFHTLGNLTHIRGILKIGTGTITHYNYYSEYSHLTGNNSSGNLSNDYIGGLKIVAGKKTLSQSTILSNIAAGNYGQDALDTYNTTIASLGEGVEYSYSHIMASFEAEYGTYGTLEEFSDSPTQEITIWNNPSAPWLGVLVDEVVEGIPTTQMWQEAYPNATSLEDAQSQALSSTFLDPNSSDYIGLNENNGRDGQPNIMSRGSFTIGIDGLNGSTNRFFEVISGINDVTNHESATSLLIIDDSTKHTWVDTLSASNHIYASASDSSEEASQDSHRVLLIDTSSGKFFYTGSYGGSGEGASNFTALEDTPSEYQITVEQEDGSEETTSYAGFALVVNSSATAVSFSAVVNSASFASESFSASYAKTASHTIGSVKGTASYALEASESVSASFASESFSASFASTASYIENLSTKFIDLSDVDGETIDIGTGQDLTIGAVEQDLTLGITADTVAGEFTGLPGFIPVVNAAGTKLQLSKTVASASFANSVNETTTALTGGKFTDASTFEQFQMPAGFKSYNKDSEITGKLTINGTLAVTDAVTISDIQISSSANAFAFGTGSGNTITHQMTGNLALSASTGITANMPANVIGFHGTASHASQSVSASHALTASYVTGTIEGTSSYALEASESVSASFASESFSASFASSSTSASYAITSSHASESFSASYASSSTSASFAITASYVLNAENGEGIGFPYSGSDDIDGTPPQAIITGSLYLSGSGFITASNISASQVTASLYGTASWADNVMSASFATASDSASFASESFSASYAITSSYTIGTVEGTASYALEASESVSASFASESVSASYVATASYVNLTFTQLTDVPSGNGENDIPATAAPDTYPNQSQNFAVVVNENGTALSFVEAVKSASFASGSDSASYAKSSSYALSASYASNVATKFTDLLDVSDDLRDGGENPEGDTLLAGLAEYALQISPVGNKLEAVKAVKSASFASQSHSSSFAITASYTIGTVEGTASYALIASESVSASFASESFSASFAETASYISSDNIGELTFLNLEDTANAYGNEGDALILNNNSLIFVESVSSSLSASFASASDSASFASESFSASFASASDSASYAKTASFVVNAITGGYSDIDFYAHDTLVDGDLTVSGSVAIAGGLTINDIEISSSVDAFTFGSGSANNITHQMTGNLHLSSSVGIMASMSAETIGFHGTASHASESVSASFAMTASYVVGTIEGTASYALEASESVSASFASESFSASFASQSHSSSFAITASYTFGTVEGTASYALEASESVSASFASESFSASFASASDSASYAITSSHASESFSASYASNSSRALTASYLDTFLSMSDTPNAYTNSGSFVLQVAPDEAKVTFVKTVESASHASESFSASYAVSASYISAGEVDGLTTTFLSLTDTPSAYTQSYALEATNGGELVFVKMVQSASYALKARSADAALNSAFATFATGALNAVSSSYADDASSSLFAVTASYALNVESGEGVGFPYSGSDDINGTPPQAVITGSLYLSGSGFITASNISASQVTASLYGTASWALNASESVSASFASESFSASFASASDSASYASQSFSASFASASDSASYASQSLSASYAISASYVSGTVEGTASYALEASESVSASYASMSQEIYVSTTRGPNFVQEDGNEETLENAALDYSVMFASDYTKGNHGAFMGEGFTRTGVTKSLVYNAQNKRLSTDIFSSSKASIEDHIAFIGTASFALEASKSVSASYADNASSSLFNISSSYASSSHEIYATTIGLSTDNYSLIFSSDPNIGYHNVANGIGDTKVAASQSLNFNQSEQKLTTKIFSSSIGSTLHHIAFEGTASYASQSVSASYADDVGSASYAVSASYAETASAVNVTANDTENGQLFIPFVNSQTGTQELGTDISLTYLPYYNLMAIDGGTGSIFATASHALIAKTASFATESFSASFASSSTSASYALFAEEASGSISASHATHAVTGGYSDLDFYAHTTLVDGDLTVSGSVAITAGLTISDIQISSSANAFTFGTGSENTITHQMTGNLHLSSSVGIMASMSAETIGFHGTASHASESVSSSFASESFSASYASSSTSASYALSASFATESFSASFASSSTSASFAITASYVSGNFDGTASYADSGSFTITASFASASDSASYALSSSYALSASHADFAMKASSSVSSSYALSSSYAETASLAHFADKAYKAESSSFATTSSYALNTDTSYLSLTDTQETEPDGYDDKLNFVPVVRKGIVNLGGGNFARGLKLMQTVSSASKAKSSSYAETASVINVTNYAKAAFEDDITQSDGKVHLTFVAEPDYEDLPSDKATNSKLYAFGEFNRGLTYQPSRDLLFTTTSQAISSSYVSGNLDGTASYADSSSFASQSISASHANNAIKSQFAVSSSFATSASFASNVMSASFASASDSASYANFANEALLAGSAKQVNILADEDGFYRLTLVDADLTFGDEKPEYIRETEGLIWNGGKNRLGINFQKPRSELQVRGVQYIDGGVFRHNQHIMNPLTGEVELFEDTALPNNILSHPYKGQFDAEFGVNHKNVPGIILPMGVGIYSVDLRNQQPSAASTGAQRTMPWSNLIHHKEEKGEIEIGDPYSAKVQQMNFFLGGRSANGFIFNPHGVTQPSLFDESDPFGGPFTTILDNPTPTFTIVPGQNTITSDGFGGHGTVGIRYPLNKVANSSNALMVRGITHISDALVVGRVNDGGNGVDNYNPLTAPDTLGTDPNIVDPDGVFLEESMSLSGARQFEIHHSSPVDENSFSNSSIRYRISNKAASSTYHINHFLDDDGYTIYNDATANNRPFRIKTLARYTSSLVEAGPGEPSPTGEQDFKYWPTDRLHIDNLSGTVTLGSNKYFPTSGYNYGELQNSDIEKDQRLVVWGKTRMHGRLHITGSEFSSTSIIDGPFPLLKVEAPEATTVSNNTFIAEIGSADTNNSHVLKLTAGDTSSTVTRYISFFDGDDAEIGKIRQNGANSVVLDSPSDKRLKTNIKSTNELDKLLKLNPVTFDWKKSGQSDIGLIAQEVDKVYPHLVNKENEDKFFMNYSGLIPVLLSGIKEQQKMIDSLEERIKKLENK